VSNKRENFKKREEGKREKICHKEKKRIQSSHVARREVTTRSGRISSGRERRKLNIPRQWGTYGGNSQGLAKVVRSSGVFMVGLMRKGVVRAGALEPGRKNGCLERGYEKATGKERRRGHP